MIPIQLDDDKKKKILKLHWAWFWTRLNDKKIIINAHKQTLFQFFNSHLHWGKKDFKKIVLGDYNDLLNYINPSNRYFQDFINPNKNSFKKRKNTYTLSDIMFDSMGYNDFRSGKYQYKPQSKSKRIKNLNDWNAYTFVKELKLGVCPYCNKEYIPIIEEKQTYKGEIDHFFPEAVYPYLSCSLFNFIPSCHTCNHDKNKTYNMYNSAGQIMLTIYPYKEGFEEKKPDGSVIKHADFKLCPGSGSIFNSKKVELEYNSASLKDKMVNSNNAFGIEGIYNACKTELNDVLGSYKKYIMEKQKSITQTLSAGLVDQLKAYNVPEGLIQQTINETRQKELESIRLKLLGVPVDGDGNYVQDEYPFRKFKNDIVDCIDEWVSKKKRRTI